MTMRQDIRILLPVALLSVFIAPPLRSADSGITLSQARTALEQACAKCHGAEKQKGGVDFTKYNDDLSVLRSRKLWRKAISQLESGAMPPEEAPQPSPEQKQLLVSWMKQAASLDPNNHANHDPGPAILRRLTLSEYNRTIRDLTGLEFDAAQASGMTEEVASEGFGNKAAILNVSSINVERYFTAADKLLAQIFSLTDPELSSLIKPDKNQMPKIKKAYDKIVFVKPGNGISESEAARKIIERFMTLAYRRPAIDDEVKRITGLFDESFKRTGNFDTALRTSLKPVLVSPHFVMRIEKNLAPRDSAEAYRVEDHELATRLSYFLWSTMPDAELTALADQHKLSDPAVLEAQVKRMLTDSRASALTDGFFVQWLQLKKVESARPSTEFYPAFTYGLKMAMLNETKTFVAELREEDKSIVDLLDCNYTYVNEELARHYKVKDKDNKDIKGDKMRLVELKPEDHRGGLLGMGSMLAMTSQNKRTSPTLRGKWILDVIFGTPPPPPPANVSELKETKDKNKTPKSFREQMAMHATDAACANCHKKMDPLGYALENYDGIGTWREDEVGKPLDISAQLVSGEKFKGVGELKKILLNRKDEFIRNMTEQLLSYALGRELDYYDELPVQEITKAMEKEQFHFSSLIQGIVKSYPFQYRKNIPPAPAESADAKEQAKLDEIASRQ